MFFITAIPPYPSVQFSGSTIKTRQPPSKVVLLLRGIAKGESTARLSRELGIGRVRVNELRQQIQRHLLESRSKDPLPDDVLEADELYQNAGEKK